MTAMKLIEVKNYERLDSGRIIYLTFDRDQISESTCNSLINENFKCSNGMIISGELTLSFAELNFRPNFIAMLDGGSVVWSMQSDEPIDKPRLFRAKF